MDRNMPLETFRDGALKATVWENPGEDGVYHTVALARTYEDKNGKLQDTSSFSANELLRVAELAREAHGYVREVRRDLAQERRNDRQNGRQQPHQEGERPDRFRNHSKPGLER